LFSLQHMLPSRKRRGKFRTEVSISHIFQ